MEGKKHLQSINIFMIIAIFLFLHFARFSDAVGKASGGSKQGKWELLLNNTGVVAMHVALTHQNTVIMFDQIGEGQSGYRLRHRFNGTRCRATRNDLEDWSWYAHSMEYDILGNKVRPLRLDTDPWCSSGTFLSNGTLLQAGGYGRGSRKIQYFKTCDNGNCDWKQSKNLLSSDRWYASSQLLPQNDRAIVVGGRRVFSYEFVPKLHSNDKSFDLPFLHQTYDRNAGGNNLYPFLHLSSNGDLFIFANQDSILFNYRRNMVVKKFPRIPGDGSRNYPSSGSSVILPLDHRNRFQKVEVMVCEGAAAGADRAAEQRRFLTGLSSCGRMVITGNTHKWKMENMPGPRLLNDMLILSTGHILIINGARRGCGGWNNAAGPSLQPYLYNPKKTLGRRFSVLSSTKIARMYHSSALVLPDGRILVAGGNPYKRYTFRNVTYPTELRLQAFSPQYMDKQFNNWRPHNVSILSNDDNMYGVKYGKEFTVQFRLRRKPTSNMVEFSAYCHGLRISQRIPCGT